MNKNKVDNLNVLRKIATDPKSTQRSLSKSLNISLGKVNYCLKALREKGLVKINNFKNSPTKSKYLYVLTPKGISEKSKLTVNFLKRTMKEYKNLKKELD